MRLFPLKDALCSALYLPVCLFHGITRQVIGAVKHKICQKTAGVMTTMLHITVYFDISDTAVIVIVYTDYRYSF